LQRAAHHSTAGPHSLLGEYRPGDQLCTLLQREAGGDYLRGMRELRQEEQLAEGSWCCYEPRGESPWSVWPVGIWVCANYPLGDILKLKRKVVSVSKWRSHHALYNNVDAKRLWGAWSCPNIHISSRSRCKGSVFLALYFFSTGHHLREELWVKSSTVEPGSWQLYKVFFYFNYIFEWWLYESLLITLCWLFLTWLLEENTSTIDLFMN